MIPPPVLAQIHWDAAAQVGVERRVLTNKSTANDASFGPVGMLSAHIALLPLVRVGAYVGADLSPMQGDDAAQSTRNFVWFGARVKVLSPAPRGAMRLYLYTGFGADFMYQPSAPFDTAQGHSAFEGVSGHFLEVPFGIGGSFTFWKPWAAFVEVGGRVGFGFSGNAYDSGARLLSGPLHEQPYGDDRWAMSLSAGIMLDK